MKGKHRPRRPERSWAWSRQRLASAFNARERIFTRRVLEEIRREIAVGLERRRSAGGAA